MLLFGGCIFAFIHRWLYAALMLAMAFGLLAGALNIKKKKGIEPDEHSKDDLLR